MPTYVYECRTCNKVFETDQRITADPLTDCDCGAKGSLRRLIQRTAVLFKGSGFYVNDAAPSKSEAKKESEPAKESAAPATTSEPTPITEAITATKPETIPAKED